MSSFDATSKPYHASSPTSSLDDEVDNREDLRYTIRPTLSESTRDSFLAVPAFHIPSSGSLRLAKMDRIRKKLGEDVPIHLVFPNEEESDVESVDSILTYPTAPNVTIHWRPLPSLPVEDDTSSQSSTLSSHSTHTRLCNARDSLLIQSSCRTHKIKRKPVPQFDQEESADDLLLDAESLRRREKERLSLILELPRELEDMLSLSEFDGSSLISARFSDRGEEDASSRRYQNL
ncbi:hypothetical protein J3R30DRAFT_648644 [Lentinula aciculospora]|uniref:Uncharacterized protein n=1 Tax=Lentinula aciculospora TaxID=153920 RepID=A0A9W9A5V9_9AGAR|nr:hypothetical protein J3R30DRAFT_648644 [Lentinula aciculospora]